MNKLDKPELIDMLVQRNGNGVRREINGKWYIARSERFGGFYGFKMRLYHAYLVLIDKAEAHQYFEDIKKKD